jgi:methylmalonyl-CoA/ethylmalonyl-CoA epimerase
LPAPERNVTLRGIHHVGVAVADLDEAISTYERLFDARVELRDALAEQGVEAASLFVGSSRVELLASTGGDTPISRFLAKRGPGMHHIALETDDVAATLRELSAAGAQLVDESPRRGLHGLEVAFVHPDALHGVLTEVVSVGS